jgi:rRNA-processing protein FCF1
MNTIVLDAGAFIAAERWSQRLQEWLTYAADENATLIVPSAVVAEIWRHPPRPRSVWLIENVDSVVTLTVERAQAVGRLLREAASTQIVDGSVATLAIEHRPCIVLTSDPDDISMLLNAAGVSCAIGIDRQADVALVEI